PEARGPTLARRELRELGDERGRSEEHTSELQSLAYLVCRLLLEKKATNARPLAASLSALIKSFYDAGRLHVCVCACRAYASVSCVVVILGVGLTAFFFKGSGSPGDLHPPHTRPFPV